MSGCGWCELKGFLSCVDVHYFLHEIKGRYKIWYHAQVDISCTGHIFLLKFWEKLLTTAVFEQDFCTAICILLGNFASFVGNLNLKWKFGHEKAYKNRITETKTFLQWYSRFQIWLWIRNLTKIVTSEKFRDIGWNLHIY